jgi:hypothetical protein
MVNIEEIENKKKQNLETKKIHDHQVSVETVFAAFHIPIT